MELNNYSWSDSLTNATIEIDPRVHNITITPIESKKITMGNCSKELLYAKSGYMNNAIFGRDKFDITDVEVKNGRVVITTFADGSKTKAVCQPEDTFDLYMGIAVCFIKKRFSTFTPYGIEHRAKECRYYKFEDKAIKNAIKLYNRKLKEEEKNKRIELEREAARVRRIEKKRAKKEAKKQAEIDKIAKAIVKANKISE